MKLIDTLFCDDIRHEASNKLSLMGLYNDRIFLRVDNSAEIKWPLPINLATLLRFSLEDTEQNSAQFEFEYLLNTKPTVKINGNVNLDNAKKIFSIAITGNGIPIEPGDLGFSIKIYDDKKVYLSEINNSALKVIQGTIEQL